MQSLFFVVLGVLPLALAGQVTADPPRAEAYGNLVVTSWTAHTEPPQGEYLVERSPDGVHWRTVKRLPITPGSSQQRSNHYQVTNRVNASYRYYRVSYADTAHRVQQVLGVAYVALNAANVLFRAAPDPAARQVQLHYRLDQDKDLLLRVFDRYGQETWTQRVPSGEAGVYDVALNFGKFQRGIYLLVLTQLENDLDLAEARVEY